jgi:hypothetical protein
MVHRPGWAVDSSQSPAHALMPRAYPLAMRAVVQFVVGLWIGRLATVAVLIVVGLLIAGAQGPAKTPVPAQQAIEQRQREEVMEQDYAEEARQREYAAPGPPAPTAGWQP